MGRTCRRERSQAADGYLYSRWNNPTVDAAAQTLNALEGGVGTLLFSSGMAAISTALLSLLKAGDHVVAPKIVYSGTLALLQTVLPRYGIEVTLVTGDSMESYQEAVKPSTKVIYGETPCNPTMAVLDLEAFAQLGMSLGEGVATMVDSTFGSPFNQAPLRHGIDVSIHSCTKYLGGHSDLVAGSLSVSSTHLLKKFHEYQKFFGGCLSPFDGYLLLRGIKTLHVRMERHNSNALEIAKFLENHEKVSVVNYPGLPSNPGHLIAKKQMRGFSGMVSFEVKGGLQEAVKFAESLKLVKLAVSLGGTDSLVEVVSCMTHPDKYVTPEMKAEAGVSDSLIRISVGLEHVEDLKQDIAQALDQMP
ncbi:cystathionine gamma-synthase isoform X2 [Nematostella vectensis]|uniref:cystathionine gamma-synthase isoform X2 n=1 Tax=Nematostella vectensis TaxID=45351 RepID=UPI00207757AE|nr:cystathionine gamma-synthase isoform X2 [Nematostella vectensis]